MCRFKMTAASKSSPMGLLYGMACGRFLMPPSSAPPPTQGKRSQRPTCNLGTLDAAARREGRQRAPSLPAPGAAAWWSSGSRSVEVGCRRLPLSRVVHVFDLLVAPSFNGPSWGGCDTQSYFSMVAKPSYTILSGRAVVTAPRLTQ